MFPQPLPEREREWIEWILPAGRSGYKAYRDVIQSMTVIGEGRRGKGEIILGRAGDEIDFSGPLAPVFAYGAIETDAGIISITLREEMDDQISVEIVNHQSDEVPAAFEERRRWTYSLWSPGNVCPKCRKSVREVTMHVVTSEKEHFFLAICANDRRLWVYDTSTQVNRLIPVTNFYNELMLHKNIRDPKIALDSQRLFTDIALFSDSDLTYAFLTYNKLKSKVHLEGSIVPDKSTDVGVLEKFRRIFSRRSS